MPFIFWIAFPPNIEALNIGVCDTIDVNPDACDHYERVVYIVGVLAQFLWEAQAHKVSGR